MPVPRTFTASLCLAPVCFEPTSDATIRRVVLELPPLQGAGAAEKTPSRIVLKPEVDMILKDPNRLAEPTRRTWITSTLFPVGKSSLCSDWNCSEVQLNSFEPNRL